ncbi:hypothetical protein HDU76_006638, partial [Blyttiomyces sp. JEL0837]
TLRSSSSSSSSSSESCELHSQPSSTANMSLSISNSTAPISSTAPPSSQQKHQQLQQNQPSKSFSLWDTLPTEIKTHILKFAFIQNILTRHLHTTLSTTELSTHANELWKQAVDLDLDIDLSLLPLDQLPNIKNGLCNVRSLSMYHRLMMARTDLNVIALKRILEDEMLWRWIERPYSVRDQQILQSREKLKSRLFDVRGLLIHIPMRRCWMSELPASFMKPEYQIRLFVIASRFGHVDFAKTLLSMDNCGYLNIVQMLVGIDTVDASSCGYFAVLEAWKRRFVDVVKVLVDARSVVGSKVGGDLEIGVSVNYIEILIAEESSLLIVKIW